MKRATVTLLLETLRLRGGMTPEQIRVAWSTVDITGLRALVAYEGAEAWLYRKLQQLKAIAPDPLMAELRRLVHATSVTNMRIDAQTIAVTSLLSEASIPWALLKGQARRAAVARFPFADARPISDVDILVPRTSRRRGVATSLPNRVQASLRGTRRLESRSSQTGAHRCE